MRRWSPLSTDFERLQNYELELIRDIYDDYKVLTAEPLDDEGQPLPKRETGYDMIPTSEHDRLTAMQLCDVWRSTPEEMLTTIPASEFLRRLALVKAKSWSQPTREQMRINKLERQERRRIRR